MADLRTFTVHPPGAPDASRVPEGWRLAVVRGGRSSERHISLRTGDAFLAALRGHEAVARLVDVEWTSDGRWVVDGRPLPLPAALAALESLDACLLALHGGEGEDGTVQGLLEVAGLAYTGSGVLASALAMDKWGTRVLLAHAGLAVADGVLIARGAWRSSRASVIAEVSALGAGALFVKPRSGGSSVATFRVRERGELAGALERGFEHSAELLVERAVDGIEVTCPVLGNARPDDPRDGLRALLPVEIAPRGDAFFDHDQKYDADGAVEHCPPRSLDAATIARIQAHALTAHAALGCAGVTRVDFIVRRGATGEPEPVLLEVNTLPGMTDRSLVPLAARAEGMGFAELLLELARLAVARRAVR